MSYSNATGRFDLNKVYLRKPLVYPDGTTQTTAYTGSGGSSTLEQVLTSGNDANGLDIVGVDNLSVATITFPDASVQNTAFLGSSSLKTYTLQYTTNQTITIPTGCRAIDLRIIGAGGLGGNSEDGNGGSWADGGAGSGGNSVFGTNLPVGAGVQLSLSFSLTSGTGFTEVSIVGGSSLARAYNGNKGGNAPDGDTGGTGASPNATPSTFDATYGTFNTYTGTAGQNGTNTSTPNTTAGRPFGYLFTDGGIGCGQRHNQTGSINNAPPSTPQGPGGVFITYYLV